ncbi:MAG: hypothetical protein ABI687_01860 [Flavitalea sp.]
MSVVSLLRLQEHIRSNRYGMMKISVKSIFPFPNILIESVNVDDNGYLWCTSQENIPALLFSNYAFRVSVKFVDKKDGFFIKLAGNATVVEFSEIMNENAGQNITVHTHHNKTLLKIQILEAELYKKKILSGYTSILQSVFRFSLKNFLPAENISTR